MKKKGFSLIELLISMALIFFLLAGMAQLIILSCAAKKKAEFHLTAASLACAKLEYLKSLPFESPELEAGHHEESVKDSLSEEVLLREWKVLDLTKDMKKIILRISSPNSWNRQAAFVLLINRTLEF